MELQDIGAGLAQYRLHFLDGRIHEQGNTRDEGRQVPGNFRRQDGIDVTRTFRVEHQADGIGAGPGGGQPILDAGDAADFGSGHDE
jgi:hypothetical protein